MIGVIKLVYCFREISVFKVNLDDKPEKRWNKVVEAKKTEVS